MATLALSTVQKYTYQQSVVLVAVTSWNYFGTNNSRSVHTALLLKKIGNVEFVWMNPSRLIVKYVMNLTLLRSSVLPEWLHICYCGNVTAGSCFWKVSHFICDIHIYSVKSKVLPNIISRAVLVLWLFVQHSTRYFFPFYFNEKNSNNSNRSLQMKYILNF